MEQLTEKEQELQHRKRRLEEKTLAGVSRPKSGPRLAPTLTLLCERTNQSKP